MCVRYVYKVGQIVRIVKGISDGGAAVCLCVCVCLSYVYKIVKIVRIVRGYSRGGAALCICKQRVSGRKHCKICRKNLRV